MSQATSTQAAAGAPAAQESRGILDTMVATAGLVLPEQKEQRNRFENDLKRVLEGIVKDKLIDQDAERFLKDALAEVDRKLSVQLDEVMHHPDLQKLEGSWRGLRYLVDQTEIG